MSHEILYTSAPQGLKPGSRGFCTVVSTAGMAKNLAERLESFSGYRHAFMTHEAQGEQNPINYAHYQTTIGGRKYHILSRIADAGLDYTHRSNKLAHHVALEPSETANAPGGPAWVMAAKGFFVEQWDGQVRTLPAGREPPASDRPTQICQRWKQLTGDAGWGGVLAESALRKGGLMSVIFPAGTPVLDLVVESLSLLPPEKRWDVTFSTYFTKAAASGVPSRTNRHWQSTPAGALVRGARTSFVSQRASARDAAPLQRLVPDSVRTALAAPQPRAEEPEELTVAPASQPSGARRLDQPPAWLPAAKPVTRTRWLLPMIAGGLVLLFLAVVVGAVLFIPPTVPIVQLVDSGADAHLPNEAPKAPDQAAPAERSPPEEKSEESEAPKIEVDRPDAGSAMLQMPPAKEEKKDEPQPFEDIRRQQNKLSLPPLTVQVGEGSLPKPMLNREPKKLATLAVKDNQSVKLELTGSEFEPRDRQKNKIVNADEDRVRRWEVMAEEITMGTEQKQTTKIATFKLDAGELWFNWETDRPKFRLAFCSLTITVDDQHETCTFEFAPTTDPAVKFTGKTRTSIGKAVEYLLRPNDVLALELKVSGIENASFTGNKSRLTLETLKDRSTTLSIPVLSTRHPASNPATKVSVELSLEGDPSQPLFLTSRLIANASVLERQTFQRGELYWQTDKWQIRSAPIELTVQDIINHRKTAQEPIGKFKIWAVQKDRFPELEEWTQLPHDQRTTAVEFAKKWNEYQEIVLLNAEDEDVKKKANDLTKQENKLLLELYYKYRLRHTLPYAEQHNFFAHFVSQVNVWCEEMDNLRMNLQTNGRLDYRLYIQIDSQDIDLVVTKSFLDPSSPANTAR